MLNFELLFDEKYYSHKKLEFLRANGKDLHLVFYDYKKNQLIENQIGILELNIAKSSKVLSLTKWYICLTLWHSWILRSFLCRLFQGVETTFSQNRRCAVVPPWPPLHWIPPSPCLPARSHLSYLRHRSRLQNGQTLPLRLVPGPLQPGRIQALYAGRSRQDIRNDDATQIQSAICFQRYASIYFISLEKL